MFRKVLLVSVLSISLTAIGQTGASSNQDVTPPATPNTLPSTTGGTVWTGVGPAGGVLLSTPSATFDSPQPTAGISLAGRAGISNSTPVNTGMQSTLGPSTIVYVYPSASSAVPEAPATVNPATEAVSVARLNDYAPSSFTTSIGAPPATGVSLAEVAAKFKTQQASQHLRTYTNADVPRQNAGLLTNVTLASNMPPQPPQSATPQRSTAPSAAPHSSAQQETATQSSAGNNPQSAQNQAENENRRLPASSTLLPLLGLLGIASAGVGVWYRRRVR